MPQKPVQFYNFKKFKKASTLVKLLIINGVISVILAILIIAINPAQQIAQVNNTKRNTDIIKILNAIYQYSADNKGKLPPHMPSPGTSGQISRRDVDICFSLIPKYLPSLPSDPAAPTNASITKCGEAYDTGYIISLSPGGNRITVIAPNTQPPLTTALTVSR